MEKLWRFFGILWFCSSFVIILSCSMALVVSLSLIVFGCPSLSCCNWLSFMSLVVLSCHCLSLVEYGCLAVFGCLVSLVVLGILVDFGCLWCLWLSLVVFVCPQLYLFVLSCICLSLVVFFGLWEFCNHAEWPGGKESWCKYRLCGVYRQGRVNFSAHLQLGQDITIWRVFF